MEGISKIIYQKFHTFLQKLWDFLNNNNYLSQLMKLTILLKAMQYLIPIIFMIQYQNKFD